jgi:hypothetical protein
MAATRFGKRYGGTESCCYDVTIFI